MAVTGVSLATALGVNGAVCLVAILIFSYLRVSKLARKFYAPKRYAPWSNPRQRAWQLSRPGPLSRTAAVQV